MWISSRGLWQPQLGRAAGSASNGAVHQRPLASEARIRRQYLKTVERLENRSSCHPDFAGWSCLKHIDRVWRSLEETTRLYRGLAETGQLPFDYKLLQQLIDSELDRIDSLEAQVDSFDEQIASLYAKSDPGQALREAPGIGEINRSHHVRLHR
jgi:hypothetical protein